MHGWRHRAPPKGQPDKSSRALCERRSWIPLPRTDGDTRTRRQGRPTRPRQSQPQKLLGWRRVGGDDVPSRSLAQVWRDFKRSQAPFACRLLVLIRQMLRKPHWRRKKERKRFQKGGSPGAHSHGGGMHTTRTFETCRWRRAQLFTTTHGGTTPLTHRLSQTGLCSVPVAGKTIKETCSAPEDQKS